MTLPPRAVESLLAGLGATADYRDAVLGDLTEEFAQRVQDDGLGSARAWYYHEAARTAPHLLGSWLRSIRGAGVRRLLGVAVTALVLAAVTSAVISAMLIGPARELGLVIHVAALSPTLLAAGLVNGAIVSTLAGYIAGWLDEESPLPSAVAAGVLWAAVIVATNSGSAPTWYRLAAPVIVLAFTGVGGMLRVTSRARRFAATI